MTDTSKNVLNSTGLLRHSTPVTAIKHYTRAQKESIKAALAQVEEMARIFGSAISWAITSNAGESPAVAALGDGALSSLRARPTSVYTARLPSAF